jgi:hypothetical protein
MTFSIAGARIVAVLSLSVLCANEAFGRLVLPPIHIHGDLAYTVRYRDYRLREDSDEQLTTLRLNANTFVWQPWFARVDLGLALGANRVEQDSGSSTSDLEGYNGRFSIFPGSRFPGELYFQKDDSRLETLDMEDDGELIVFLSDYTLRRHGFHQVYQSRGGKYYGLRVESTDLTDEDGVDYSELLEVSAKTGIGDHRLSANLRLFDIDRTEGEEDVSSQRGLLRHSWRSSSTFNIDNVFDYSLEDTVPTNRPTTIRENIQFNSFTSWQNSGERPLRLTSNFRASQTGREVNRLDDYTTLYSLSLGALYDLTQTVQLTSSAGYQESTGSVREDEERLFGSLGARYRSPQYDFGGFSYSWSPFTRYTREDQISASSKTWDVGVGHDVRRRYLVGEASTIGVSFSQTASTSDTRTSGELLEDRQERNLTTLAGVRWSRNLRSNQIQASLTVSENRRYSNEDDRIRLTNLQISGTQYLSRHSTMTAHATVQNSDSNNEGGLEEASSGRTSDSIRASVRYQHRRAFGVHRLRFTSEYVRTDREFVSEISTEEDLLAEKRADRVWENRLRYDIGRLELRLIARSARRDEETENSVIARVVRRFLR